MRQTPLQQAVLAILEKEQRPLSVPDIQQHLAEQDLKPNKTTLYRLFERLKSENIIEQVLLDSQTTYYELKTHHHHHFTCSKCDNIKCIEDPELENQIHKLEEKLQKKGLKVEQHHFSLSGVCDHCS